jgi:sodium/pantothenate symporter
MSSQWNMLLPMGLYLLCMLGMGIYAHRSSSGGKGSFLEHYFIGDRGMGGFVLAMTLIATYTSASSFIGGPGVASTKGLGWVFLAMIQVPTAFLTLGILGKKLALVSRKIQGVTVTDYLWARYRSKTLVLLASLTMLIFFLAIMVAQCIGGARLFQVMANIPYGAGLALFALVVVLYTTLGGFRAVVITDALQGVVMVFATIFLLAAVVRAGGGLEAAGETLRTLHPEMMDPSSGGTLGKPFLLSFWVLVGLGILGLPQTTVRGMGFRDSRSLHNAMLIGTLTVGFLMLGMHLVGFFGRVLLPPEGLSPDLVIPTLTVQVLPPFWAGIFIAGPLAAIMSTVDSLLLLAAAALVKDLYLRFVSPAAKEKTISRMSFCTTALLGAAAFLLALNPPDLIVWINLFAFGGLEAAFLWPTVLGLYWKRANASGALLGMLGGVGAYFWCSLTSFNPLGMHQIVPVLLFSLLGFLGGSWFGKKPDPEVLHIFFGE